MFKMSSFPRERKYNTNKTNNTTAKCRRKGSTINKKLGLDERMKKEGGPCGYSIDDNHNDDDSTTTSKRKERVFSTPKSSSSRKINNPYKTGISTAKRSLFTLDEYTMFLVNND